MKAISLHQPWATAIALRLKRFETRGFRTKHRGPLAIHAAKRWEQDQDDFAALAYKQVPSIGEDFPLGGVVAVAWLKDCYHVEQVLPTISPIERLFGDYRPGRFAWLLEDVQPLRQVVPFSGKQGFFEVPDALLLPHYDARAFGWPPASQIA